MLFRSVLVPAIAISFLTFIPAHAQTVAIKLVDGRNGRPMSNTSVNTWPRRDKKDATPIQTDQNGVARLTLEDRNSDVKIQTGYVLCQSRKADHSWLSILTFPAAQILDRGVVTANHCGKAAASAQPGELILFVRPLTWWEKAKQ